MRAGCLVFGCVCYRPQVFGPVKKPDDRFESLCHAAARPPNRDNRSAEVLDLRRSGCSWITNSQGNSCCGLGAGTGLTVESGPLTKPADFNSNFTLRSAHSDGQSGSNTMLSVRECSKEALTCQSLAAKEPNQAVRRSLLRAAAQWKSLGGEITKFLNAVGSNV